jgi:hypothetical protein
MLAPELEATLICFKYYVEEAIEAIPRIADEYDEDSIVETVRNHAIDYEYCWFNAYEGQRVVGFIAGFMTQLPWNKTLIMANCDFIYLLPTHRNLENFKSLMAEFEAWGKTINAYQMQIGDIGIDIERRQKLFEAFGFKPQLLMSKEITQ